MGKNYQTDDAGQVLITGVIEQIIFENTDTGFAVCLLGTDDELITVAGAMPGIEAGDQVRVTGKWVHNPKYGRQIQVVFYERVLPEDAKEILAFLSSRAIRGIGPKTAERIVALYGSETFDVIENHPEYLSEIPGISRAKAEEIHDDFIRKNALRSTLMFFKDFFGSALIGRIYETYGPRSVELTKEDPYRLCVDIEGIGFEKADVVGKALGIRDDDPRRLLAGLSYVLTVLAAQNGHVCLPEDKLLELSSQILHADREQVRSALLAGIKDRRFVRVMTRPERYMIYAESQYKDEKYIAEKLLFIKQRAVGTGLENIYHLIDLCERRNGITYSALQRKAIALALSKGVFVLTGGPGTGKTMAVKGLIYILSSMSLRVALCAPTGRAAKRLSEATQENAKTVHRLLEYQTREDPDQKAIGDSYIQRNREKTRFMRNEHNLLEEDVIILDEASMMDNALTASLLRAIKPGARLVLIGDADQLPSVGPGDVLRDIIASGCFETVELTEIFRQAGESRIVTNAHEINEGRMPVLTDKKNDFFFLKRIRDDDIVKTVTELCKTRLPQSYGEQIRGSIQVIAPSRKGIAGTENLNLVLQHALNPRAGDTETKETYTIRERTFFVGDRVMQIRNNYELSWHVDDPVIPVSFPKPKREQDRTGKKGKRKDFEDIFARDDTDPRDGEGVFNGDIGEIVSIDPKNRTIEVLFEDGRRATYEGGAIDDLDFAYAVTVHKSQGSEYDYVIIPLGDAPEVLLTRNLLYTAVTRARVMVILVGREEVISKMVSNNRQLLRYTGLSYWLKNRSSDAK